MYQLNPLLIEGTNLLGKPLKNLAKLRKKLRFYQGELTRFYKDGDGILQKRGFPYKRYGYDSEYLQLKDYINHLKDSLI